MLPQEYNSRLVALSNLLLRDGILEIVTRFFHLHNHSELLQVVHCITNSELLIREGGSEIWWLICLHQICLYQIHKGIKMFFHFRSITPVHFQVCMRSGEGCCSCLLPRNQVEIIIINLRGAAHFSLSAGCISLCLQSPNLKHPKESRDFR